MYFMLRQRLRPCYLRFGQVRRYHSNKMVIAQEFKAEEYDAVQLDLMEERLIVLDREDNPIGEASKKTCPFLAARSVCSGLRTVVSDRSLDGEYPSAQQYAAPRFLCFPVQTFGWQAALTETSRRENYFPCHVDQYVLLPPFGVPYRDGS